MAERTDREYSLAVALRKAREDAGITQLEAGLAVGKNDQAIYRWETARATPSATDFGRLCQLYGVRPDTVLGWSPENVPMPTELDRFLRDQRAADGRDVSPMERALLLSMPVIEGTEPTYDQYHYFLLALRRGRTIGDAAESARVTAEAKARGEARGWRPPNAESGKARRQGRD